MEFLQTVNEALQVVTAGFEVLATEHGVSKTADWRNLKV